MDEQKINLTCNTLNAHASLLRLRYQQSGDNTYLIQSNAMYQAQVLILELQEELSSHNLHSL